MLRGAEEARSATKAAEARAADAESEAECARGARDCAVARCAASTASSGGTSTAAWALPTSRRGKLLIRCTNAGTHCSTELVETSHK